MRETPLLTILNRSESREAVEEHFSSHLEFLRDLADYGSNLVMRSFESSARGIPEIIVCGVLLKQVVAMLDALEVLLSAGISHAAYLQARTAFEASIYIDFILASEAEHRARCYLVSNYRDERLWASRATKGTIEEEAFSQVTGTLGRDIHSRRPGLAEAALTQLAEVRRILQQPALRAIDEQFDKLKRKRGYDPDWYVVAGAKSVAQIAKVVGRQHEYAVFYSKGSVVTHSGSYRDHLRFVGQEVRFKPIRHIADLNNLLNFAGSVAMHTYKRVIMQYRPAEILAFTKKYTEDWREPFLNAKHVNYSDF